MKSIAKTSGDCQLQTDAGQLHNTVGSPCKHIWIETGLESGYLISEVSETSAIGASSLKTQIHEDTEEFRCRPVPT